MRILTLSEGVSEKSISYNLASYSMSMFENAQFDVVNLLDFKKEDFDASIMSPSIDLMLISLDMNFKSFDIISNCLSKLYDKKKINNKPIFLLLTGENQETGKMLSKFFKSKIEKSGNILLDTFMLPNMYYDLDTYEINSIKHKLELVNALNKIKYSNFKAHYKDNSFTCGIDPAKDECGDAREY